MPFRVADVHAQQAAGEERRLVAAGAGADLDEHVAVVVRILRQQRRLQLALEVRDARFGAGALLRGEVAHRRVVRELHRRREVGFGEPELAEARDDRRDVRMLLGERAVAVEVGRDVGRPQQSVQLVEARGELVELGAKRRFHRTRQRRYGRGTVRV